MQSNAISSNPLLAIQRHQLLAARRPAATAALAALRTAPAPAALATKAEAFTAPSAPSATPTAVLAPQAPPPDLSAGKGPHAQLQQLLKDWGRSDSTYDLDADGKVGMRDLMMLLARMGKPASTEEPVPDALSRDEGDAANPLEKLLAAWGRTDSEFDLNRDGTVGMPDLLMLLARMRHGDPVEPSVSDHPTTDVPATLDRAKTPLEKLLADWGKTDSEFDLNHDGTVGMPDLLKLLASMGEGNPGEPTLSDGPTSLDRAKSPIERLRADWGKTDSKWDLDGNGTVGMSDLLKLLASMGQGQSPIPDNPTTDDRAKTPLERLRADWGKTDSKWDLDGNGTVGMGDLLAMLASMGVPAPQAVSVVEAPAETPPAAPRALRGRAAAAHVAAALLPQLERHQDPAALRAEVDRSQLSTSQKELVRARIAALTSTGRMFSALG